MMRELEAVKVAAEETMNLQRTSYENKLRDLEGTLVSGLSLSVGVVY